MKDLKKKRKSETLQEEIKQKLERLKAYKSRFSKKLTIASLKAMRGFEHLSDEKAKEIIQQLEEYASIVLVQMNRLGLTVKR